MVNKWDLIDDALHPEFRAIISNYVSDDVDYHVRLRGDTDDERLPAIAYEEFESPRPLGFDGAIHVDEVNYDSNGDATDIVYREDLRLRLDVYVVAQSEQTKSDIYTDVREQFTHYRTYRDPEDLHADVDAVEVDDSTDADRDGTAIRGDRVSVVIDYSRYQTFDDFVPISEIRQSFERDPNTVYITESVDSSS